MPPQYGGEWVLARVSTAALNKGDVRGAIQAAKEISSQRRCGLALTKIAIAVLNQGDIEGAIQIAKEIPSVAVRIYTFVELSSIHIFNLITSLFTFVYSHFPSFSLKKR